MRFALVVPLLFVASCTSTSPNGTASSATLSRGITTAGSAAAASGPETVCQAALPPGYTLFTARTSSVGELRRQLSQVGPPVISDTVLEFLPGVSSTATATRCWGRSASTFVVYAVGLNDEFIEFCETTLTGDLPLPQSPPLC